MTDPPLLAVAALAVARRVGALLVNWLHDLYPETAAALDVPLVRGPVVSGLAALRNRALRHAAATVVVGHHMSRRVAALGASKTGIHVIANWCDDEAIRPVTPAQNPLRQAWGLQDKFIVGYSGNLGRAHDIATVLAAADALRDDRRLLFLMIGGGSRFDELKRAVAARGLNAAFRFVGYQERQALRYSLALPDVHWISLNPAVEGLIVPSKFYGVAAAGRPMIVVGAADGELAPLVRQHGCGAVVAPGDGGGLARLLARLCEEPATLAAMGMRARTMLDAQFSRRQALQRWQDVLDALDRPDGAAAPAQ